MENIVWYLIFISLIIFFLKYKEGLLSKVSLAEKKDVFPYYLKKSLMNVSERALYVNLSKELGSEYVILTKVRIEDFIGVKSQGITRNERFGFRNRIKSRHVDFLVCDQVGITPLLVVELDGKSHDSYKVKARDERLDGIYGKVGLKYKHVRVGSNFEKKVVEIKNLLKEVPEARSV